jgi:DNA polymerase I
MRPYQIVTRSDALSGIAEEIVRSPVMALDLETTALDPREGRIRLCSINTGENVYVIDLFQTQTLGPVTQALRDAKGVVAGQNLKFDCKWLLYHEDLEFNKLFDSFRASNILHTGREYISHDLYALYRRELNIEPEAPDLGASDWTGALTKDQYDYAAEDVIHLPAIRQKLVPQLVREGLVRIASIEFGAILPEAAMELNGFHLDAERWRALFQRNEIRKGELDASLRSKMPSPHAQLAFPGMEPEKKHRFNLDSTEQVLESFLEMGLTQKLKDQETGRTVTVPLQDTKEITLAMLSSKFPIVSEFIEYRGYAQRVKAFGEEWLRNINPKTKRVHTSFWPFTGAGRYSSSKPNLQQIPRDKNYRECFRAEAGNSLAICDYGAIELRLVAELSRDARLIEVFRKGEDPHRATAALMAGVDSSKVTKEQRQAAKPVNFGFCIAEGQRVLTSVGPVPIEFVTTLHLVWDGVEWVSHEGVVFMGEREVSSYDGLTATPDHSVYTEDGFRVSLVEAASKGRLASGAVGSVPIKYDAFDRRCATFNTELSDKPKTAAVLRQLQNQGVRRTYDLMNAGPRHRFTVEGKVVSNCYGMSAPKLVLYSQSSYGVLLTEAQAYKFREKYFEGYSGVGYWHTRALRDGARTGQTRTLWGRRRFLDPEKAYNEFLNSPSQGCLRPETLVLLDCGYTSISQLLREGAGGRRVWTGTNWADFQLVNRGDCQGADLFLSDGTRIPADTRHKLLTVRDDGYVWKDYEDLQVGDRVAMSLVRAVEFPTLPASFLPVRKSLNANLTVRPPDSTDDFWYWIGYYYGNGWKSEIDQCFTYVFGDHRKDLRDKCAAYWARWGVNPKIRTATHTPVQKTSTRHRVEFYSVDLVRWLGDLGICDADAHTKRLLPRIFTETLEHRKAFMRGFMDADGHFKNPAQGHPELHLCQRPLLEDTKALLRTMGVETTLTGPQYYKGRVSFTLHIHGLMYRELFDLPVKRWPQIREMDVPEFWVTELKSRYGNLRMGDFPTASAYQLWKRMMYGRSIGVYTFDRLCALMNWELETPRYAFRFLKEKRVLDLVGPTYTLAVSDPGHRFDAVGVITKNSGADGLKNSLPLIYQKAKKLSGGSILLEKGARVGLVHMVHDEVVLEHCNEGEEFASLVQKQLQEGMIEGMAPMITQMPTTAEVGGGDSWASKS